MIKTMWGAVAAIAGLLNFLLAILSAHGRNYDAATYFMVSAFMFFWMAESSER